MFTLGLVIGMVLLAVIVYAIYRFMKVINKKKPTTPTT
jgi:hypothetical protein